MSAPGGTAQVKLLTAEVRTLQVGNRQVTLSVFRQLDTLLNLENFEPFGRVRDGHDDFREVKMVGRDTTTDALVGARIRPQFWLASDGPLVFTHWLSHTWSYDQPFGTPVTVAIDARSRGDGSYSLRWRPEVKLRCRKIHVTQDPGPGVEICYVDLAHLGKVVQELADEELADQIERQRHYEQMTKLPLIVLAGLR